MRLTKSQLRKMINEETEETLDHDHPSEIDPVEDAFSGGENLVLPLDHSKAVGSEAVTPAPERYDHEKQEVVQMTETQLRSTIRQIILKAVR